MSAILDASVRILDQEGSEALTTTRVAEVAGVSVGTLYQYFAHKDAIVDALQDREFERATELVATRLGRGAYASDQQVARAVIEGLLELYRRSPALHRLLVVQGLHVAPAQRVQAFDLRMVTAIRAFLFNTNVRMRRKNLDAAAFVAYHSVRATMLARLLEDPAGLDDQTMADELSDLVLRYLVADEPLLAGEAVSAS